MFDSLQSSFCLTLHSEHMKFSSLSDKKKNDLRAKPMLCLWHEYNSSSPFCILTSSGNISHPCVCMLGNSVVVCGTDEGVIDLWDLRVPSSLPSVTARSMETNSNIALNIAMEECASIIALTVVTDSLFASLDSRGILEIWCV